MHCDVFVLTSREQTFPNRLLRELEVVGMFDAGLFTGSNWFHGTVIRRWWTRRHHDNWLDGHINNKTQAIHRERCLSLSALNDWLKSMID